MKRILFCVLAFAAALAGCGRISEKFGRSSGGYTTVTFNSRPAGAHSIFYTPQSGGVMIYFSRVGDNMGGLAFGFPHDAAVAGASISVPNGSYKVYALGWEGSNPLEGNTRCAFGNGGAYINLVGGGATVSLSLTDTACAFNTAGPFSSALGSDQGSPLNFDSLNLAQCFAGVGSCSTNGSFAEYYRIQLSGGEKPPGSGPMIFSDAYALTSTCKSFSAGVSSSNVRIPSGGAQMNPPLRILFFGANSSCSGVPTRVVNIEDGLRDFLGAPDGKIVKLVTGASLSTSEVDIAAP